MSDYTLEPIEEDDLDMESKFKETGNSERVRRSEGLRDEKETREDSIEPNKEQGDKAHEKAYEDLLEQVKSGAAISSSEESVESDPGAIQRSTTSMADIDPDARVQRLIEVARNKGPVHAFQVAIKLGDHYTTDKLHDTLITDFYDELVKKELISEK